MASGMKYLCGVCDKPFLTISSRNKHERVNRKCSQANSGKVSIVKVGADHGHEGEGRSVEFTLDDSAEGGKQCSFCCHEFTKLANAQQHICLLSPSVSPDYTVLKLVEEDAAAKLKQLHRFSSPYQKMRTCQIMGQAVPGVFPLIFTGSKVGGRSASSLLRRLRGFGCVGSPAYSSLRQALSEVTQVRLPLCFTIYLPDGGVVSLGKDLTVPSNRKELGDLRVRIEGGEIIVMRDLQGGGAGEVGNSCDYEHGGGVRGGGGRNPCNDEHGGDVGGEGGCGETHSVDDNGGGGGGGRGRGGGGGGGNPCDDESEGYVGGGGGSGGNPGDDDNGGDVEGGDGGGGYGDDDNGGGGGGGDGGGGGGDDDDGEGDSDDDNSGSEGGGGSPGDGDNGGGGGGGDGGGGGGDDCNGGNGGGGGVGGGQPSREQLQGNNLFRNPEFMTESQLHQVSFIHSYISCLNSLFSGCTYV